MSAYKDILTHALRFANITFDNEQVLGFCLGNKKPDSDDIDVIKAIPITHGDQVELGFSEKIHKALEQVKEESKTDALTGIANRKAFDAALEHSILTSRETNKSFCLLLLDIDHFKVFNDTYGHLIGDKVLRFVAASLKRNIKGNDFVARFGGEEFAILFSGVTLKEAKEHLDNLREEIATKKFALRKQERRNKNSRAVKKKKQRHVSVTISIGFAQQNDKLTSPAAVLKASDKALYRAKGKGRNCVCLMK